MSEVLEIIIGLWKFDIAVFSEPWLYIPLLIPAFAYLVFFLCKWSFLTAPIWLPIVIIIRAWKGPHNE